MSFWGELKRRNVFKVGVAYAIVAWLLVQIANTFFPLLNFPKWAVPMVAVLVILGFPLALIHAWAYEVTPDGIKKTKEVPLAESITHITGRKLNYVLTGLLIVALAYILFDKFYLDRHATIETQVATAVVEKKPVAVETFEVKESPETIAVLPFDDLSPEKDQEYFVLGLSEEILNSLCQIPNLGVTGKTSSFAFKGTDKTIQEIAEILGVGNILEGSVRKSGNALRITAQLIRASDGLHLWSKAYDRELKDIFAVQEDIATAVADELKIKLGVGKTFTQQLGGTDNVEAYELYLAAKGQLYNRGESWVHAYESIEAATELDPDFALAWALKGFYQLALVNTGSNNAAERAKAINAVLKAIEIEPNLPEAYVVLGFINLSNGNWIEAQSAFQKALNRKTEHLWGLELSIAQFYGVVGYLEKARNFFEYILHNDPISGPVRMDYIGCLVSLGDLRGAEEANRRGEALSGDQWKRFETATILLRPEAGEALTREEIDYSSSVTDAVKDQLGSPEKALSELRRIYRTENMSQYNIWEIAAWAAYFGDADFALDAMEKATGVSFVPAAAFWYPVMHEVRQLPRFKEFVREIGLVDYWNKFGWPDICHPTDDGDFVCD